MQGWESVLLIGLFGIPHLQKNNFPPIPRIRADQTNLESFCIFGVWVAKGSFLAHNFKVICRSSLREFLHFRGLGGTRGIPCIWLIQVHFKGFFAFSGSRGQRRASLHIALKSYAGRLWEIFCIFGVARAKGVFLGYGSKVICGGSGGLCRLTLKEFLHFRCVWVAKGGFLAYNFKVICRSSLREFLHCWGLGGTRGFPCIWR